MLVLVSEDILLQERLSTGLAFCHHWVEVDVERLAGRKGSCTMALAAHAIAGETNVSMLVHEMNQRPLLSP